MAKYLPKTQFIVLGLFSIVVTAGCIADQTSMINLTPVMTVDITKTQIQQPTDTPPLTQMAAKTNTPSILPLQVSTQPATIAPQQATLSGIVFLTDEAELGGWPFAYHVELRQENISKVAEYPDENRPQQFIFENIEPGTYQLWVLIPPETLSFKKCYDIGLPNKMWKLGRILEGNETFTDTNRSYREAFLQAEKDNSSDSKTYEFYAVLENLDIKLGIDNYIDVTLICKDG